MKILKTISILTLAWLISACSAYQYKQYSPTIEGANILDLSEGKAETAIVYFDTVAYREMGIPFHRFLLATHLNDQPLPSAGRKSTLDLDGHQALRIKPGEHNIQWCWGSMNSLGTGGSLCGFNVGSFLYEPHKMYLISWRSKNRISGSPQMQTHTMEVNSVISDLETGEILYPKPTP